MLKTWLNYSTFLNRLYMLGQNFSVFYLKVQAFHSDGISVMTKAETLKRTIRRERAKNVSGSSGSNPTDWENLVIPEHLKVTNSNKKFCILDKITNAESKERILGFASKTGLDLLQSSNEWLCDGTFKIAKSTLFEQVLLCMVIIIEHILLLDLIVY